MKWKSHSKMYDDAVTFMKKMQKGVIQNYLTPWPKINDAGIKGWLFNSIVIIAARPGGGKTLMKDQIVREGFKLNQIPDLRVLEFSLEMVGAHSKLREFSSVSKKSVKFLCSAEQEGVTIDDELINKCVTYSKIASKNPIDIIEDPVTAKEFGQEVEEYMNRNCTKNEDGTKVYKKTVVTLDHSVLIKKAKGQSTIDMLNALGEECTRLKKKYPILFIILSQLNRDITTPARCENGKYANYPNSNDIFGADALNQHADMLIVLDRPYLRHITAYGPDRFIIQDDTVLAAHILKTRTGDTRVSFFEANFHNMRIDSANTPPQEKINTKKK